MAHALYTNNATATLAGGISSSATTITLNSGQGSLFPSPTGGNYFYGTLTDAATGTLIEIVKVTSRTADSMTVARGQQGTVAQAYNANDKFELRVTAGGLSELATVDGFTVTGPIVLPGNAANPLEAVPKQQLDSSIRTEISYAISPGIIMYFAASSAPTGWIKANGALLSRAGYPNLFAVIGTTFGAGDGSTTFQIPDLRGEFLRGLDDGRGVDSGRALGSYQTDVIKQNGNLTLNGFSAAALISSPQMNYNAISPGGIGFSPFPGGGNETRPRNIALLACIKY